MGDFDLAVLCQAMVEPDCAGVMLTFDPSQPESGRMLISAAPGLGTMAVGGSAPVDLYIPLRSGENSHPVAGPESGGPVTMTRAERFMDGAQIPCKTIREVGVAGGGVRLEQVPAAEAQLPLLSVDALDELVHFGEMIESLDGVPQDVEWAHSKNRGLAILQARPLRLAAGKGRRLYLPGLAEPLTTGTCASAGKAVGRVRLVHSTTDLKWFDTWFDTRFDTGQAEDLSNFPTILVLPQGIVDAAQYSQKDARSSWRRRLALHKPLALTDILSVPLTALCEGLTTPGLSYHSGPDVEALPEIFFPGNAR